MQTLQLRATAAITSTVHQPHRGTDATLESKDARTIRSTPTDETEPTIHRPNIEHVVSFRVRHATSE